MSNTKHTPGPWKVSKRPLEQNEHGAYSLGIDQDGGMITELASVWCHEEIPSEEEMATAKLISASGELLNALQEISSVLSGIESIHFGGIDEASRIENLINAAIKKATE